MVRMSLKYLTTCLIGIVCVYLEQKKIEFQFRLYFRLSTVKIKIMYFLVSSIFDSEINIFGSCHFIQIIRTIYHFEFCFFSPPTNHINYANFNFPKMLFFNSFSLCILYIFPQTSILNRTFYINNGFNDCFVNHVIVKTENKCGFSVDFACDKCWRQHNFIFILFQFIESKWICMAKKGAKSKDRKKNVCSNS